MSTDTVCGTGNFAYVSSVREHVVGVVAGGACVPQSEAGDAVGVDVLGRALELGEDREVVPGVFGVRVRDLEQHGAVALHDEWAVRHNGRVYARSLRRHPAGAGATDAMAESGRVRSMSALRSRARSRPLATLAGASR